MNGFSELRDCFIKPALLRKRTPRLMRVSVIRGSIVTAYEYSAIASSILRIARKSPRLLRASINCGLNESL